MYSPADHIDLAPSRDRFSNETRNKQPSLTVQRHWVERSIVIFEFEVGVLGGIDLFHVALQLGLSEDPKGCRCRTSEEKSAVRPRARSTPPEVTSEWSIDPWDR